MGASIALELSRSGLAVTVIDKASGPGLGSTSASSAVVRFNYSSWAGVATSWESKQRWDAWEEHLGYRDPAGLARLHRTGMVFLDVPLAPRRRTVDLFDRAGIPFEEWDAEELQRRVPHIDVGRYFPPKPVRSEEFFAAPEGRLGAIYTPDAGYVDDPQLAAGNLARAAMSRGAEFLFGSELVALGEGQRLWQLRFADGHILEAPLVVNAAGPWSRAVNALAGVGTDFAVSVRPMRQEVHHVAAPPSLATSDPIPSVADLDLGTYMRPDTGNHLLVGGTEPECDPLEWIDDPDQANPLPTVARFEAQVLRAARRFPDLQVPTRPRGIAGVYDVSSDWTPIYDRTDRDGFFVAIGTSGNQFKNAPTVGSMMDALIRGVRDGHDHDADPLHFVGSHTGLDIDLGAFSRRRIADESSTGTVLG